MHKTKLLNAASGLNDTEIDDFLVIAGTEDGTNTSLEEEYEVQYHGLSNIKNLFQKWAEAIYEESQTQI